MTKSNASRDNHGSQTVVGTPCSRPRSWTGRPFVEDQDWEAKAKGFLGMDAEGYDL